MPSDAVVRSNIQTFRCGDWLKSLSPVPERFHILLRVPPGGNRVTWKLGFRCQLNSIYIIYIHVSTRLAVVPVDKKHCEQSILKCEVLCNTTHLSGVENPVWFCSNHIVFRQNLSSLFREPIFSFAGMNFTKPLLRAFAVDLATWWRNRKLSLKAQH